MSDLIFVPLKFTCVFFLATCMICFLVLVFPSLIMMHLRIYFSLSVLFLLLKSVHKSNLSLLKNVDLLFPQRLLLPHFSSALSGILTIHTLYLSTLSLILFFFWCFPSLCVCLILDNPSNSYFRFTMSLFSCD